MVVLWLNWGGFAADLKVEFDAWLTVAVLGC